MAVAVKPALFSVKDSAIVKQPACAAATSSSGFVPLPSPKRALNEYGVSCSVPLWAESVPLPSCVVPCQRAFALRCMFVSSGWCGMRSLIQAGRTGRAPVPGLGVAVQPAPAHQPLFHLDGEEDHRGERERERELARRQGSGV